MRFTRKLCVLIIILSSLSLLYAQSNYRIDNVIETELYSGPGRTSAFLSPDGSQFAHFTGDNICLYSVPGIEQGDCYELGEDIQPEVETVRWSPDGRYIAFADNDALRKFKDADIQVLDLDAGEIRNVTDDGYTGGFGMRPVEGATAYVDIAVAWSEDNQLAVLRYIVEEGESRPDMATHIVIIDPDTADVEKLITLETEQIFMHLSIAWHGDSIAAGRSPIDLDSGLEGIDLIDTVSGELDRTIPVSENLAAAIWSVQFSADGNYLYAYNSQFRGMGSTFESTSLDGTGIIDLSDDAEYGIDAERGVMQAGFAPDGHALAYIVTNLMNPEEAGLYITDTPGEPGELVLAMERLDATSSVSFVYLTWASNNTILVRDNTTFYATVIILTD